MRARAFYKAVTMDRANLLERLIALLEAEGIRYAVIGGQAVNAYVEPLVSLDLDLAIATEQQPRLAALLRERFTVREFPHRLNVSTPDSDLRIQIQTDPRYAGFVDRAELREVLGYQMRVAAKEDVLQGKIWAVLDPSRRGSKRLKDLTDIARLLDAYPELAARVPEAIRQALG